MDTQEVRKLLSRAKSAANKAYQETMSNEVAGHIEDCMALIARIQSGIKRGCDLYTGEKIKPEPGAAKPKPPAPETQPEKELWPERPRSKQTTLW